MFKRGQNVSRHQPPAGLPAQHRTRRSNMAKIANKVFEIETISTLAMVLLAAAALISA
jgi:hypothetical protein